MSGFISLRTFTLATLMGLVLWAVGSADAATCGDFIEDESITASDALGVLRSAVGLEECLLDVCDFNGDNRTTTADALAVLRTAVGDGPASRCPNFGCDVPGCEATCPLDAIDCCDVATCSGHGTCAVERRMAVCACDEGWVGAKCNGEADRYPFADEPSMDPPSWTTVGDLLIRPASYGEQMRHDLRPGTFFIADHRGFVWVDSRVPGRGNRLCTSASARLRCCRNRARFPDAETDLTPSPV